MHNIKTLLTIFLIIFLPAFLILMQNDTGSALVYIAFILPIYREGLSGVFLFIGLTSIILFISALVMNKLIIVFVLIRLNNTNIHF